MFLQHKFHTSVEPLLPCLHFLKTFIEFSKTERIPLIRELIYSISIKIQNLPQEGMRRRLQQEILRHLIPPTDTRKQKASPG